MSEEEGPPKDLFGNPIVDRGQRRAAPRRGLDNADRPTHTAVPSRPTKQVPLRLFFPSKWPYIALAASLGLLVLAAALKIPMSKTPVVELDLSSSDGRTIIGLMSIAVIGIALWVFWEMLCTVAFNAGLKNSRSPRVCIGRWRKNLTVGCLAALTMCLCMASVWFTWTYTHPQIMHVYAQLEEFGRNPPTGLETGAILTPAAPKTEQPKAVSPESPHVQGHKEDITAAPGVAKVRRTQSKEPDETNWIQTADRWLLDIFASPPDKLDKRKYKQN